MAADLKAVIANHPGLLAEAQRVSNGVVALSPTRIVCADCRAFTCTTGWSLIAALQRRPLLICCLLPGLGRAFCHWHSKYLCWHAAGAASPGAAQDAAARRGAEQCHAAVAFEAA